MGTGILLSSVVIVRSQLETWKEKFWKGSAWLGYSRVTRECLTFSMLLSRQAETISEPLAIPDSSWMTGNTFAILSLPVPHLSLNVNGECD